MDAGRRRQSDSRPGNTLGRPGAGPRKGSEAERLARGYLEARGLKRLAANYRCRYGELDLVMRDGDMLVVVEVRSRRSDRHGAPEASINHRKRRCLMRAAQCFVRDNPQFNGMMLRFDVVGVLKEANRARFRWIRNALQFDGR
ncbi:MAG: YraN family protein [Gammaproteobacteria bacterium]|nr:YraN family protein [Gammaproteobacteria bacterium]MDE0414143.1 YraN family protein [Gammaproteobacteria bacterium]